MEGEPGEQDEMLDALLASADASPRFVSSELLPLVYDELRALASAQFTGERAGQTLQPTALVHDAWLRLSHERRFEWNDKEHFFRAAAQAMRRILVERARGKETLKRGSRPVSLDISTFEVADATMDERVLLVEEALKALETEDPESAQLVMLKFFGGLTNKEVAAMNGVTERTIERQWLYAKTRLMQLIGDIEGHE